jgi:hypothetical protein
MKKKAYEIGLEAESIPSSGLVAVNSTTSSGKLSQAYKTPESEGEASPLPSLKPFISCLPSVFS